MLALLTGLSKVPRVDGIGQLGGFWSSAIWPGAGGLAYHHVEAKDMVQGMAQQTRGNINDKASNKPWRLQKISITFSNPSSFFISRCSVLCYQLSNSAFFYQKKTIPSLVRSSPQTYPPPCPDLATNSKTLITSRCSRSFCCAESLHFQPC